MPQAELLPNNLDAERSILGLMLEGGAEQFSRLSVSLSPDDFFLEKHKRIWYAMEDLQRDGTVIDVVTVADRLQDKDQLDAVGGCSFLLSLRDGMGQVFGGEHWCGIVHDDSLRRRAIVGLDRLSSELRTGISTAEALVSAEKLLRDLASDARGARKLRSGAEIVREHGGIDQFMARTKEPGIPTRWPSLNQILGGWKKQEMTVIAARPSVGKTAFALDCAIHAAVHGVRVAIYSLEMSEEDLIHRMACSRARVDHAQWRRGELYPEQEKLLRRATWEISEMPILYDADSFSHTVPGITISLRQEMQREPIGLVIVDYLQLLEPIGRYGNRTEAVSAMTRQLKLASDEFKVPFMVLSQLTRGPEHEKRRPVLSDLRESGSIEQDANAVVFIHPKETFGSDVRACEFIVAKQRNGPLGITDVNFMRRFATFEESLGEPSPDEEKYAYRQ